MSSAKFRSVDRIVPAFEVMEGAGFLVHRAFPTPRLDMVDPFLLLDQMGPVELAAGEAKGAPDHPHRGFETVTYMQSGTMEHRDSAGHAGNLGPGDVQWMTAGAGVVHSEMPAPDLLAEGGRVHGFQLWVNLPAQDKMMAPRYQEISAESIPVGQRDGIRVRVIAGEAFGKTAVIETRTPISYLHFSLPAGSYVEQPIVASHNAFAFVGEGQGLFGTDRQPVGQSELVLFNTKGDAVRFETQASTSMEVLVISGAPIGEPVARYGPFVMNTGAEIEQAIVDYRAGRMGRIA